MHYRVLLKTTGSIVLSLACIILLYFVLEPVTDYLDDAGYFWLSIASNASLAVIIYFLVRWFNQKVNHLTINSYGFSNQKGVRNFFIGAMVATSLVLLTLFFSMFYSDVELELIGLRDWHFASLIEFIIANLVVAAWEEIYFRGLLVNTLLRQNLNFTWTAIISSGIFTLVHFVSYDLTAITPFWMLGVFLISTILLLLYILTRSIWTSIGCHFFWDSMFMSLDERENDFGIIQMSTYVKNSVLIDNISIWITGIALILFFILCKDKIRSSIKLYVSGVTMP